MKENKKLIKFEWKKLFPWYTVLLFLGLVVVQLTVTMITYQPKLDEEYMEYTQRLSGTMTEEKSQYIEDEKQRLYRIVNEKDSMNQAYVSGQITKQEFTDYNDQYADAVRHQEAFDLVYQKYQYFLGREDTIPVEFFYDSDWNTLLNDVTSDFILLFLVMAVLLPFFTKDYESGVHDLIWTSKGKNHFLNCQTRLAVAISIGSSFLFLVIRAVCAVKLYLPGLHAPIQSLNAFGSFPFEFSVLQTVALLVLIKIIASGVLSCLLFILVYLLKKAIPVAALYIFCTYFLFLFKDMLGPFLEHLGLFPLVSGVEALKDYQQFKIFHLTVPSILVNVTIALFIVLWSAAIFRKIKRE